MKVPLVAGILEDGESACCSRRERSFFRYGIEAIAAIEEARTSLTATLQ